MRSADTVSVAGCAVKPFRKNTPVVLTGSQHGDVPIGTTGVVDCKVAAGYGVRVMCNFTMPGGGLRMEERVIYCDAKDLKKS